VTSIREIIRRRFTTAKPLEPGIYHYIAPEYAEFPYRLHVRIEPNGEGIMIIDASTILHLNQTAAEYAYHLVKETALDEVVSQMGRRYEISGDRIRMDFQDFRERVFTLIDIPDLDPVTYLELGRDTPYSGKISAPYRLDCGLTYQLPAGTDPDAAPTKRVERELTTEEWITIIDKAWQVGIPHIVFTGGEPTLRDDLVELISHAEANGQVTGLLTDGIKLSDSDYFNSLLQSGLDHLMVVLSSRDERAWTALEIILPEDIFTTVHITVTTENADQVSNMLDRLLEMDVNAISLSNIGPELDEVLQTARDYVAELQIPLVWDLPVPYSDRNPVSLDDEEGERIEGAGRAWLYIEPDGDVLPTQGTNQILGNFLRDNWESIWK
jgi:organic radical activating enzyme